MIQKLCDVHDTADSGTMLSYTPKSQEVKFHTQKSMVPCDFPNSTSFTRLNLVLKTIITVYYY